MRKNENENKNYNENENKNESKKNEEWKNWKINGQNRIHMCPNPKHNARTHTLRTNDWTK